MFKYQFQFTRSLNLGKLFDLYKLQFPQLQLGIILILAWDSWGLSELTHVNFFGWCLPHSDHSMLPSYSSTESLKTLLHYSLKIYILLVVECLDSWSKSEWFLTHLPVSYKLLIYISQLSGSTYSSSFSVYSPHFLIFCILVALAFGALLILERLPVPGLTNS